MFEPTCAASGRRGRLNSTAAIGLALISGIGIAGHALAAEPSTVVVASVSGQAPSSQVPFFGTQTGFPGGLGVPVADVTNVAHAGATIPETSHFQAEGAAGAKAQPGLVILNTSARVTNEGPGNVGNVSATAISGTTDVITIQGTPAQLGQHLTLHGKIAVNFSSEGFAFGQTSNQFPDPPTDTNFADVDELSRFSVASTGIAGGVADIALEHRGINNETGETFDEVRFDDGSLDFSLDIVVGEATEISFLAELTSNVSAFDAQPSVFGAPAGDRGLAFAEASAVAQWLNDDAFLSDPATGAALRGFSLTSANGFDWLGDGIGPAAVPEPASWALMITGFGLAGTMLRRRRSPQTV